jgi:15-cis-phytoene synthase
MRNAAPETVAQSYRRCREVARREARNFFYGFLLLPQEKRDALCALYAFMRGVDDIADDATDAAGGVDEKRRRLAQRRAEMDRALRGEDPSGVVWPAFRDTMERYSIPPRCLHDLISGAEMDQTPRDYGTFDELRQYCYCVAGTVGVACLHVFGFSDPSAPELAEKLGIAFQLTNILRDVPGDLAMGRIYLPREDLLRLGAGENDLRARRFTEEWRALVEFQAARAWQFYSESWPLIQLVNEDSRAALWALARIYLGVLERVVALNRAPDSNMFTAPLPRLSTARKLWILARARMCWRGDVNALRIGTRDGRRPGGSLVRRRAG